MIKLAATEERIAGALGPSHPLRLQAKYFMYQATSQLLDYSRSKVMLAELYDEQCAAIGPYHPDTLATELGAVLVGGRRPESMRAAAIRTTSGSRPHNSITSANWWTPSGSDGIRRAPATPPNSAVASSPGQRPE